MYGLPQSLDLSFFVGRELMSLHFAMHTLILHFDGDVSVTVTSAIGLQPHGGSIQQHEDFREGAPSILGLLSHAITSAAGDVAGTLSLQFADGSRLYVYDNSERFESYTIRNGDQLIVV